MGDTFYGLDRDVTPGAGDTFANSRTADVWFDVDNLWSQATAWATLNTFEQDIAWYIQNTTDQSVAWDIINLVSLSTAWAILNNTDQDISWSVFAATLYYIQQFCVNYIQTEFSIKAPLPTAYKVNGPVQFDFIVDQSIELISVPAWDLETAFAVAPVLFNFSIQPVAFNFEPSQVTGGSTNPNFQE